MDIRTLTNLIEQGDEPAVAAALSADPALVQQRTPDGDTALHIGCWQKQARIVETLLRMGADVNSRGCYERTPLHYAVHEGDFSTVPIVQMLIAHGADAALRDDDGNTPADWARIEMHEGLKETLVALGNQRGKPS